MIRTLVTALVFSFLITGVMGFSGVHEDCAATTLSRGFTCQSFSASILLIILLAVGLLVAEALNSVFAVHNFFRRHASYPIKREFLSWHSLHEASPSAF